MRASWLIVAGGFMSCAQPAQVSTCGLTLSGASDTWDAVSCAALASIGRVYGPARMLAVANRYTVMQDEQIVQHNVGGETFCDDGFQFPTLVVASLDYSGALAHELAHAADGGKTCNPEHAGWGNKESPEPSSVWAAIAEFHGEGEGR